MPYPLPEEIPLLKFTPCGKVILRRNGLANLASNPTIAAFSTHSQKSTAQSIATYFPVPI
jgi:hypothetical protein